MGCPHDRADGREPALADRVAPIGDQACDVLPHRAPVRQRDILHVTARVRGLDEAEDPGAVATRRGEVGLDRFPAEPGVDGERVGERLVTFEVGGGVGACGRADIAALAVGDDEQAGATRVGADLAERLPAVRAERLEEGELRLDGDGVRGDGVDDAAAEARDIAAHLNGKQVGDRVEPDDELAALPINSRRETVAEMRPCGYIARSLARRRPEGRRAPTPRPPLASSCLSS